MTGHAYTDKQIALAMLAVDDPLQWGRLGADNKLMLRQFVDALSGADRERAITGEPVAQEPALWVSPGQLAEHDPQRTGKPNYLPCMKRQEGLFTQPLYAAPITGETSRDVAAEGGKA